MPTSERGLGAGRQPVICPIFPKMKMKKNGPRGIDILCTTPPNPPKNTYNFMGCLKLLYNIDYLRPPKDLYSFRRTCLTPAVAASFDLVHSDLIVYLKYEYSSVSHVVF